MANRTDITVPIWGLGLGGYGQVTTGTVQIRQRINIAITTTKGTDPCRPLFGSDVYKYVDAPITIAIPNIKKAVIDAVGLWVPEVKIISITHLLDADGHLSFMVTYELVGTEITESFVFFASNGIIADKSTLTLQAYFPDNPDSMNFLVFMQLNGLAVSPPANLFGFTTKEETLAWVTTNWGYLADWFLSEDKLVAYVKDPIYTTGFLGIRLSEVFTISALFPDLEGSDNYHVQVIENPGELDGKVRVLAGTFWSPADVLNAVRSQWSDMGVWNIENFFGDFDSDFGSDFSIGGTYLVLQTPIYSKATIIISAS